MTDKAILVLGYSRPDLLRECISSIRDAQGNEKWKKILVWQSGFPDTEIVANEFKEFFDITVRVNKQFTSTMACINFNRITGSKLAFEMFSADYLLAIEEDAMIATDALSFIDFAINKYSKNRAFRGVNLGSLEARGVEESNSYSLLRFGLQGQAGMVSRRTWARARPENLLKYSEPDPWDSNMEFVTKSGFMVTPNASRLLDRGWTGTYAPNDPSHPYFINMEKSWSSRRDTDIPYHRNEIKHSWRADAINFKLRDSVFFHFRATKIGQRAIPYLRTLGIRFLMINTEKTP